MRQPNGKKESDKDTPEKRGLRDVGPGAKPETLRALEAHDRSMSALLPGTPHSPGASRPKLHLPVGTTPSKPVADATPRRPTPAWTADGDTVDLDAAVATARARQSAAGERPITRAVVEPMTVVEPALDIVDLDSQAPTPQQQATPPKAQPQVSSLQRQPTRLFFTQSEQSTAQSGQSDMAAVPIDSGTESAGTPPQTSSSPPRFRKR